jgi:hypothetical protein
MGMNPLAARFDRMVSECEQENRVWLAQRAYLPEGMWVGHLDLDTGKVRGITHDDFQLIYDTQNGRCEVHHTHAGCRSFV